MLFIERDQPKPALKQMAGLGARGRDEAGVEPAAPGQRQRQPLAVLRRQDGMRRGSASGKSEIRKYRNTKIVEFEEGRGGLRLCQSPRFPSPLVKPDVRICRIRLSDRLHVRLTAGEAGVTRVRRRTSSFPKIWLQE